RCPAGPLACEPQPVEGVTYADKLTREDGRLDWTRDPALVERQVRALTPWPGCWFDAPTPTGGVERIKVLKAELAPDPRKAAPGTLLDDRLTIACADGGVRLTLVQRPGKAPVDGAALLRGFALPVGTRLGDAACSAGN
ncbi:methionyl-tRNA formyltransferase, partial [Azospirillum brasilense]|nr:methionyl-tRNA formyltransferase [Azospirillum brasilense]